MSDDERRSSMENMRHWLAEKTGYDAPVLIRDEEIAEAHRTAGWTVVEYVPTSTNRGAVASLDEFAAAVKRAREDGDVNVSAEWVEACIVNVRRYLGGQ